MPFSEMLFHFSFYYHRYYYFTSSVVLFRHSAHTCLCLFWVPNAVKAIFGVNSLLLMTFIQIKVERRFEKTHRWCAGSCSGVLPELVNLHFTSYKLVMFKGLTSEIFFSFCAALILPTPLIFPFSLNLSYLHREVKTRILCSHYITTAPKELITFH